MSKAAIGMGPSCRAEDVTRADWRRDYAADFARYRDHREGASDFVLMATELGLWALLIYRVGAATRRSTAPAALKRPALAGIAALEKLVEIVTGITLPSRASIGPGLYIGHHGGIVLHENVRIGAGCNISQGVTIGVSGRPPRRGVPRIGDRVYIATNAVVVGPITVGDDAAIAACSLVSRDVEPGTTVMGVPAISIGRSGSVGYV